MSGTKNTLDDLRDHLFEALEMLKTDEIDTDKANAIAKIGQVVINGAKLQLHAQQLDHTNKIAGRTRFFRPKEADGDDAPRLLTNGQQQSKEVN